MTTPANDRFDDAIELDLVGQRRRVRSIDGTTVGATIETDEPQQFMSTFPPVSGTVWYKFTAPAGTTGPFRIGMPSPGGFYMGAVLWRQRGTGFAGLQFIDRGSNDFSNDTLHNNCEGYAQGRDNWMWEFALGGGEEYFIQVGTYTPSATVEADFTLEWCYDPVDEPAVLAGAKVSSACPGTPLSTHGFAIAYYAATYGFPARFAAGRRMPYTPALPVDGHAFYVEDVREFANVHIRRLIVGWTPEYGPFFYGYLDPHGWLRTWSVDNEDPTGTGAADMAGGVHQGILFEDNPTSAAELATIRSIPGEGSTDPTTTWGNLPAGTDHVDMAWGGPGRPNSMFGTVVPFSGPAYTVEWDLVGNIIDSGLPYRPADYGGFGAPWTWCSLDGTKLYQTFRSNVDFNMYMYSVDIATHTVTKEQPVLSGDVVGVRSSNGHIVTVASEVEVYDPAITSPIAAPGELPLVGEFAFPLVRPVSEWAFHFGRSWRPYGVTADGKHLFFGLIYPLTWPIVGASGGRDVVTDMWWMDLDTGECERKFMLAHPFHDTYFVPDVEPPVPTSNVRGVRLYKQADVG